MISNVHAIVFEYHQFLFQFWKGICLLSRNISQNLVRDGFPPQFYYHYTTERTYPFFERDFLVSRRLWSSILSFARVLLMGFFVLSEGKQKGYNSF